MTCEGCRSVVSISRVNECQYTIRGIKDLLDCPCKECLVKLMCNTTCPLFSEKINDIINSDRVTQLIRPRMVRKEDAV